MAGNIRNRLAELAALAPASRLTAQPEPASCQQETDAEWQARIESRADRIARKATIWGRDERVYRYAWLLLLALEMRQSSKVKDGLISALENRTGFSEVELSAYKKAANKMAESLAKQHFSRVRGAAKKLANDRDGKQSAKAGALELWKERQAGKQPKLRTVEQFAIEAMRRWPVLTSAKVICGWSAKWAKDVREGRPPAC